MVNFLVLTSMQIIKRLPIAILLAVICGCAAAPTENVQLVKEPDALAELQTIAVVAAERLRSVQASLQEERLALDMEARRQAAIDATYIPSGFETKSSMKTTNWPDVICQRLAEFAGYESPTVIGDRPKAPFMVDINKRNVPLWEIVHELGLKTGKAFVMEIYENSKIVRCIYARPEA